MQRSNNTCFCLHYQEHVLSNDGFSRVWVYLHHRQLGMCRLGRVTGQIPNRLRVWRCSESVPPQGNMYWESQSEAARPDDMHLPTWLMRWSQGTLLLLCSSSFLNSEQGTVGTKTKKNTQSNIQVVTSSNYYSGIQARCACTKFWRMHSWCLCSRDLVGWEQFGWKLWISLTFLLAILKNILNHRVHQLPKYKVTLMKITK